MKNENLILPVNNDIMYQESPFDSNNTLYETDTSDKIRQNISNDSNLPEILFITSYPPRVCGIATYSQDLIKALNNKFGNSFFIKVCALETEKARYDYPDEVKYVLNTSHSQDYSKLAHSINQDHLVKIVVVQHEFGLFQTSGRDDFMQFLYELTKPVIIVFHTVLPDPDESLRTKIKCITAACESVVVMTNNSAKVLKNDYDIPVEKITVIAHGTHLVRHINKKFLKEKYGLKGKKVLSTFGLLSSGKSIETTLESLPNIIKRNANVVFLIIGKTHPDVIKSEGENYRNNLKGMVISLKLQNHVIFINDFLALPELLEYLQLTDIYLFTSKDPNQAVSGTFAYAMSCACPIISTPIPHALEALNEETGIIIDFQNSHQLAKGVIRLLNDEPLRKSISTNTLQKIVSTAWENSAIAHAMLFNDITGNKLHMQYSLPAINLDHLKKMTTGFGIIQFSKINEPDIDSGYTLDDNARALIAMCMHYELTGNATDIVYLNTYFEFIKYCFQPSGNFLNYINQDQEFTKQNDDSNLDDANGRTIWALGYLISRNRVLPEELIFQSKILMKKALLRLDDIHSTRAMAFVIKGLYYYNSAVKSTENSRLVALLADRLVEMYRHESSEKWEWFESYLTYANSILPEAMLCAWSLTGEAVYKRIGKSSFDFLIKNTYNENGLKVISNKSWLQKGQESERFGEQPIDVAYTIFAMGRYYDVFKDEDYLDKMNTAFNWFLGNNYLHQIIYNPCTGGCYDGLEENHVNVNQGAESTISYLMARLTIENYRLPDDPEDTF
ncbi:MAG: glycosyltransferase [Bacteroidales bacterium]|nr:glycosyltransferase [Bacteroidales bacterium]